MSAENDDLRQALRQTLLAVQTLAENLAIGFNQPGKLPKDRIRDSLQTACRDLADIDRQLAERK